MGIIKNVLSKMGYVKKSAWENFWLRAKEAQLIGGNSVKDPYRSHLVVYKAVKAIGDNVPQADFQIVKNEEPQENHPLSELFRKPNPFMSESQLFEATAIYLSLCGNCYWWLQRSVGQSTGSSKLPSEIWVFNPKDFKPIPVNKNDPREGVQYKFRNTIIPADEIIHFKYFNPYDPFVGMSPYEPIEKTVDMDWKSIIYNSKFFENNAEIGFALSTDTELSDTQFKRLEAQMDAKHKGFTNAFKTAIFEAGLKPVAIGAKHKDMQFIDQRKFNREEILGMWRVPKSMFSITDDLNYATFMGQKKVFWTDTIMPILRNICEKLDSSFIGEIDSSLKCRFDFSNVGALQEDIKEKAETAKVFFDMGINVRAINQKLELGFDEEDVPDSGFVPFNMVPATEAGTRLPPNEPAPQEEDDKSHDDKQKIERKRFMIWKQFVGKQSILESKYEKSLNTYFFTQRQAVLSGLKKSIKQAKESKLHIQLFVDWQSEKKKLQEITKPILEKAVEEGKDFGFEQAGAVFDQAFFNNKASSLVSARLFRIKDIVDRTEAKLKDILKTGIEKGQSVNEIAQEIKRYYNFRTSRSKTIARTETASAVNGGNNLYMESAGIKKKQWITARDERVRHTHMALDGEVVLFNKTYPNGLQYPNDPDGTPEEVINCRCTSIAVIEES